MLKSRTMLQASCRNVTPASVKQTVMAPILVRLLSNTWAVCLVLVTGCASLSSWSSPTPESEDLSMLSSSEKIESLSTTESTSGEQDRSSVFSLANFIERFKDKPELDLSVGHQAFEKAETVFRAKDYLEAEDAFHDLSKKYVDTPIEEDALFMKAECQFLTQRYPEAQDSYETMLQKYEGSRHLDRVSRRMFAISREWLKSVFSSSDPKGYSLPVPNFFDKSKPMLDLHGRALEALTSIRLHDPSGPLADDALMMTATYYFLVKKYEQADFYFQALRQDYPNSEHQSVAHLLGVRSKMHSYQGPEYDGQQLEQTEKLIHSTIRQFPDLKEHRRNLVRTLASVRLEKARRLWETANYYRRSGHPQSAQLYDVQLTKRFPDTKWAALAQTQLDESKQQVPSLANRFFSSFQ